MKIITLLTILIWASLLPAQSTLISAFEKSYELEQEGEYTKAIAALKEVYDANSYELNLRLGWLHYSAGLFTESSTYYQKCIDLLPMSIEARLGFVYPASALGHWDQVLGAYQQILEIDPNQTLAHYRTGLIYYGRQQYDKAEKHFQKVLTLYPFDYDSLLMMGWTRYFLGKTGEAKALFNKVLLYNPGDESALEGLDLVK